MLANIIQPLIKLPDNAVKVMIHGVRRGRVIEYISSHTLLQARVALDGHYEYGENEDNIDLEALRRSVIDAFDNWCKLNKKSQPEIIINSIDQVKEVNQLVDMVASHLNIKVSEKQNILEVYNPKERLKKFLLLLREK